MLLTRQQFKQQVFDRDDHKCVVCGGEGKDAHHLIERKLFDDGGYYLDNGVTLCHTCHWEAEKTNFTVDFLREKANINVVILPQDFDQSKVYDKWGNILQDETLIPGPLYYEENVQKVMKHKIRKF
jgi:predicted restriction endonuclease